MYTKKPFEEEPKKPSKEDRRTIRRRHIIYYLRVWDLDTKQVLGHIVDINMGGMMLISEKPIPTNREYSLEIRWEDAETGHQTIRFRATSCWCKPDVNASFYDSGFQLLDQAPDVLDPIQDMIKDYGFHD